MEQSYIIAIGNIERIKAEIEAMKIDNEIRKMQGHDTFNYPPESFWDKANEIQNAVNEMFKY